MRISVHVMSKVRLALLIGLVTTLGMIFTSNQVAVGLVRPQITPTPFDQRDLACGRLGVVVDNHPIFDGARTCPEYLVQELPRSSIAAITSIAYAPTCDELGVRRDWCGALFFVRPDAGRLMWVGAYDPESRTYDLNTFASGLTTPNGLAWHDGAWYVSGGANVYRLADDDGDNLADTIETVIDHLPDGGGQWTNSVNIGPDGRLYVSKGASCNACEESDPRRAALLSYNLDGSDETIEARGLRNAFDFAWHPTNGALWIVDQGREDLGEYAPAGELNRATEAGAHFGWPYCAHTPDMVPIDNAPDTNFCQNTTGPAVTFSPQSRPSGMIFYHGAAFPEFEGDLLVVLGGSWHRRLPSGYALMRVCFDANGELETCRDINGNPVRDAMGRPSNQEVLVPVDPYHGLSLDELHIQGQSFYPDHPVDVAVSAEGWIAISVMEGRIMRLRPAE